MFFDWNMQAKTKSDRISHTMHHCLCAGIMHLNKVTAIFSSGRAVHLYDV